MGGWDWLVLCGAAFVTSILSAIVGMAGGLVLLSVMLLYFEPLTAIPLHGVIQLVSNSSRTIIQRHHIAGRLVWRYALLLAPMAVLGLSVARKIPPHAGRFVIGLFVLVATWRPGWLMLGVHPRQARPELRFTLLGAAAGFLQMTVGAIGPLTAPFFLHLGLERRGIVGTKAAVQTVGHAVKIALFGAFGFAYREHALMLVSMCSLVIAGNAIGSRLLAHVNEHAFMILFKGVLSVIATWLLMQALVAGLRPSIHAWAGIPMAHVRG